MKVCTKHFEILTKISGFGIVAYEICLGCAQELTEAIEDEE